MVYLQLHSLSIWPGECLPLDKKIQEEFPAVIYVLTKLQYTGSSSLIENMRHVGTIDHLKVNYFVVFIHFLVL